jgi:hypothetical protein
VGRRGRESVKYRIMWRVIIVWCVSDGGLLTSRERFGRMNSDKREGRSEQKRESRRSRKGRA